MIFDCFPFFNELEILELRLMELDDYVDYFVIAEASTSHNGTPKEYFFENNKERYKKWSDKIIYIKVDDMPTYDPKNVFKLEYFQRRALMRGLHGKAKLGDTILLSDCDEIPNVDELKSHLDSEDWILFKQVLFYYFVNNKADREWGGTVMARFGSFGNDIQRLRFFAIRNSFSRDTKRVILNGGWHYSYMTGGDAERIRDKVALFAETNLISIAGSVEEIKDKVENQKDLYNRSDKKVYYKQSIVDISNNKPKMLDAFLEKYPNFIYKGKK